MEPIKQLSPTGEVLVCPDDDQFGYGQSVMKCGYEIVAMFWHSVAPGKPLPYTGLQVHQMAHSDYSAFDGPDVASNKNGMTDQQLYADLARHAFHYIKLPMPVEWELVRAWLKYGYPVIIGGVKESSVHDLALNGCPYPWIKPGVEYWHIIMATGLDGADSLKFRDTANVDATGKLRPGPRRYRCSSMSMTTATVAVPTWLPIPPPDFDPTRLPSPPPPPANPKAEIEALLATIEKELAQVQALLGQIK